MDCKYLYIDNIKINFVRRIIEIDGEAISLTPREFDVVEFLLDNMNKVVSRQAIQEAVWGRELAVSSRTLDTHVSRIRSKLGLDFDKNMRIIPIYSIGYRLVLFGAATTRVEPHDEQHATHAEQPRAGNAHAPAEPLAPIARPAVAPHLERVAEYH
ncbi:winged helix-turn-helix domain-containing protein [Burkholderia pseudomallei]|uniref:winged helix-turn-helix domain-containing protein n=1 Tax=Burkholderia pseudomallei TaxID=28450 RepID=UPI001AD74E12|nr:winged helix-turn-helix domain-containing protein [Burkholderia pseudomallei]MBO7758956.1 winged helix-turn-helix transcriptional regulator [Burkholderia pseudomallei]